VVFYFGIFGDFPDVFLLLNSSGSLVWSEDRWGSSHSFPVCMQNLRSLKATNIEKYFKLSHNKESHKVKVLARIYFGITG
jgi:hypothetical protein